MKLHTTTTPLPSETDAIVAGLVSRARVAQRIAEGL